MRVCFVGYRDINMLEGRFEIKPFTDDVKDMVKYIGSLKAAGGDDIPEDVQGGLKMMLM